MDEASARERLSSLEEKHRALEGELKTLTRRAFLTPDEQRHAILLKKQKLTAKDEIFAIRKNLQRPV